MLSRALWRDRSIRWRILVACCTIDVLVGLVTILVTVVNARSATDVEMAAAMRVAERYVREAIARDQPTLAAGRGLQGLSIDFSMLRHVRLRMIPSVRRQDRGEPSAAAEAPVSRTRAEAAPGWFARLIAPDTMQLAIPVVVAGETVGTVEIEGEPADEIAEVWQDLRDLVEVCAIGTLAFLVVLYVSLGRLLRPLAALSDGLQQLEAGHFGARLAGSRMVELTALAERFNALAAALDAARTENTRLKRRIISVQDDERRQFALDLHDEAGPCLFGIQANAASLVGLGRQCQEPAGRDIVERATTIAGIAERLQAMNRSLLKRLRPMALGNVPLADLIADLVADFTRREPAVAFDFQSGAVAATHGDTVDLTVFRCVQESLTNALRHAEARSVVVMLDEREDSAAEGRDGEAARWLILGVHDDGKGIAPGTPRGFGLTGIEERVSALGGTCTVSRRDIGGTAVDIRIPVETADDNHNNRREERNPHAAKGAGHR